MLNILWLTKMYVYTKKINLLHTACITLFIITYQLPSLLYMWECIGHTVDVSKIDCMVAKPDSSPQSSLLVPTCGEWKERSMTKGRARGDEKKGKERETI